MAETENMRDDKAAAGAGDDAARAADRSPATLAERMVQVLRDNPGVRIDCYVLFASHTDAMQLYHAVRERGIGARISTTPRQARASCGVALLVSCDDALAIGEIAQSEGVDIEGIVPLPNQIDPHRDVYC